MTTSHQKKYQHLTGACAPPSPINRTAAFFWLKVLPLDEQVQHFLERGYVRIPQAFTKEQSDRLTKDL